MRHAVFSHQTQHQNLYDDSYLKVGHNLLGFDVYMHNLHRKLVDPKSTSDFSYTENLVDTLCLAKALKKRIKLDKDDDFLAWQYRLNHLIGEDCAFKSGYCASRRLVKFISRKFGKCV